MSIQEWIDKYGGEIAKDKDFNIGYDVAEAHKEADQLLVELVADLSYIPDVRKVVNKEVIRRFLYLYDQSLKFYA